MAFFTSLPLLLCILQQLTSGVPAARIPDSTFLVSQTSQPSSQATQATKQEQNLEISLRQHSRALSGSASSPKKPLATLPPPPPPKPSPGGYWWQNGAKPSPSPPSPSPPVTTKDILPTSSLWGTSGELYTSQGPLVDVSWAGYQQGTVEPPSPPVTYDFKRDFGAMGDGHTDDSNAWDAALAATPRGGVLYIPPGTYVLTRQATVTNKPFIIRGAGIDITTLYYPYSMNDLFPGQYNVNVLPSVFNSGPFFLNFVSKYSKWMTAKDGKHYLADITGTATRGDYYVTVSSTKMMKAGQWIQLLAFDQDLNLATYMYGGHVIQDDSMMANAPDPLIRHLTTIKSVVNATCVRITRPVPFDLRREWRSQIVVAWDIEQLDGFGMEDLTARFRPSNYPGHLREEGFNWLNIYDLHNVFLRRLRVVNSDFGIDVNADFGTVDNVTFDTDFNRAAWNMKASNGMQGHHAIGLNRARGILVKDFKINLKFVHDLTLFTLSSENVFTGGQALDLSIDFHKQPMHGNLFQNLDCGACTRLYNYSGGPPGYGLQSGMYNTWWGLYSGTNNHFASCLPGNDFGANLNFIGLGCNPVVTSDKPYAPIGWTLEHQNPHGLTPRDLHQAMKQANLNPLFP